MFKETCICCLSLCISYEMSHIFILNTCAISHVYSFVSIPITYHFSAPMDRIIYEYFKVSIRDAHQRSCYFIHGNMILQMQSSRSVLYISFLVRRQIRMMLKPRIDIILKCAIMAIVVLISIYALKYLTDVNQWIVRNLLE